jgi:hypothetical protein
VCVCSRVAIIDGIPCYDLQGYKRWNREDEGDLVWIKECATQQEVLLTQTSPWPRDRKRSSMACRV